MAFCSCIYAGAAFLTMVGWAGRALAAGSGVRATQSADEGATRVSLVNSCVAAATAVVVFLLGLADIFKLLSIKYDADLVTVMDFLVGFGFGAGWIALVVYVAAEADSDGIPGGNKA